MAIEQKRPCKHDRYYHPDKVCYYLAISSTCTECYLALYNQLFDEKNIQINRMKVFSEPKWERGISRRLFRKRECYNPNFNCPSLGLDCTCNKQTTDAKKHQHILKSTGEIPKIYSMDKKKLLSLSHTCFPKYHGQSERTYRNSIRRKNRIQQKVREKHLYQM